jgi:hypothetical protein
MFDRVATQITAFGLAVVVTFGMLAGVNGLATREHADVQSLAATPSTQVVVITAFSLPRS